jgi:hypothetical protein
MKVDEMEDVQSQKERLTPEPIQVQPPPAVPTPQSRHELIINLDHLQHVSQALLSLGQGAINLLRWLLLVVTGAQASRMLNAESLAIFVIVVIVFMATQRRS